MEKNKIITQIYGIRSIEDAQKVMNEGVNNLGICYGRNKYTNNQLNCEEAKKIFEEMRGKCTCVGLTVATNVEEIICDLSYALPDILHISGDIDKLSPAQIQIIKDRFPELKIMQAIPVYVDNNDINKIKEYIDRYEEVADYFLIDTAYREVDNIGATGSRHDINIDKFIVDYTKVPCILAGGLSDENVRELIEYVNPYGVDSFTSTNYDDDRKNTKNCKDIQKVVRFVRAAKNE